jgi:DNA-binding NtrC family response regulator
MKNARILLVEDDPSTSALLGGWLERMGATVVDTASVEAAERALGEGSFELIISDVHLPGNSRLEWVERVLQRGPMPPPLLLLSGNPELETALKAANLPVAGYLVKPPDFTALGKLLEQLVHDYRQRTRLRQLAEDTARLAASGEAGEADAPLRTTLRDLARCLTENTERRRDLPPAGTAPWRTAIVETIAVLEKTKHSFRSKELGTLRQRLEQLVTPEAAA